MFSQDVNPEIYLQKYTESLSKCDNISISYKLKTWTEQKGESVGEPYYVEYIHRKQDEKVEWIGGRLWEDREKPLQGAGIIVNDERTIFTTQPGYNVYVNISPKDSAMRDNLLFHPEHGSVLLGKMYGNNQNSIGNLLKCSKNLTVELELTAISGVDCWLIHGDTEYGHISLWISPEMNFEAMKWEIVKNENHRLDKKLLGDTKLSKWVASYQVDEVTEEASKSSRPRKAMFTLSTQSPKGVNTYNYKYDIADIDYDPDFKKLNAFTLKSLGLPEGTKVYDSFAPGITYEWYNGQLVPLVDKYAIEELEKTCEILHDEEVKEISPGVMNKDVVIINEKLIEDEAAIQSDNNTDNQHRFSVPVVIFSVVSCLGLVFLAILFYWIRGRSN